MKYIRRCINCEKISESLPDEAQRLDEAGKIKDEKSFTRQERKLRDDEFLGGVGDFCGDKCYGEFCKMHVWKIGYPLMLRKDAPWERGLVCQK